MCSLVRAVFGVGLFLAGATLASRAEEPANLMPSKPLPGLPHDLAFDAVAKSVDLDDPTLQFVYKGGKHGGSSVGFHIARADGRKKWSFAPNNRSNNPEAEVIYYRMARLIGISHFFNPVTYYRLGPKASARFMTMLEKNPETDKDRKANRAFTMKEIKTDHDGIIGTFRIRVPQHLRFQITSLIVNPPGYLNTKTRFASLVQASGPMPSDELVALPEVKSVAPGGPKPVEMESELARQMSVIMTFDVLLGQWDRFVTNLEGTVADNGRVQFIARDNGGATVDDWDEEWKTQYDKWLTRFDPALIDTLRDLQAFTKGKKPEFLGYKSVDTWKSDMGFRKAESFTVFKQKLNRLLDDTIPKLHARFGDKIYFRSKTAGLEPSPTASMRAVESPTGAVGVGDPVVQTRTLAETAAAKAPAHGAAEAAASEPAPAKPAHKRASGGKPAAATQAKPFAFPSQ